MSSFREPEAPDWRYTAEILMYDDIWATGVIWEYAWGTPPRDGLVLRRFNARKNARVYEDEKALLIFGPKPTGLRLRTHLLKSVIRLRRAKRAV